MNRRELLVSASGVLGALAGGGLVADATRADILLGREYARGDGQPVTVTSPDRSGEVAYVTDLDGVRDGRVRPDPPTDARYELLELASIAVLDVLKDRVSGDAEGLGSGVRWLLFGPVVTADHVVHYGRDGEVRSEPGISLDRLISIAPRTVGVAVTLDGREYTDAYPVGVAHVERYDA